MSGDVLPFRWSFRAGGAAGTNPFMISTTRERNAASLPPSVLPVISSSKLSEPNTVFRFASRANGPDTNPAPDTELLPTNNLPDCTSPLSRNET